MDQNCQTIATIIKDSLESFIVQLETAMEVPNPNTKLSLSTEQITLFSSIYGHNRPSMILIVDDTIRAAQKRTQDIQALSSFCNVNSTWHLIEGELSTQERAGDVVSELSKTIHYFLERQKGHHFILPSALLNIKIPSLQGYKNQHVSWHRHESVLLSRATRDLVDRGYTRYEVATEPGSFSVRGELVDIRLPHTNQHFQIIWQGELIDQIIQYIYPNDQQHPRRKTIPSLNLPPVALPPAKETLRELLNNYQLIKPLSLQDTTPEGIIFDALTTLYPFPLTTFSPKTNTKPLHVVYENHDRVTEYLHEHQLSAVSSCSAPLATTRLSFQSESFAFLTEAALFKNAPASQPISYQRGLRLVGNLTPNRPAVHSDHGVGIFTGLQTRTINNITREYLMLQYAAGDTLSIPVEYAHKITPYLGEKTPTINRLGGTLWQKTRRQAKHDAEAFARELIALASQRTNHEGAHYELFDDIESKLSHSFPHQLTHDQEATLQEIYGDFRHSEPIDRLIVGDVGFGKTEVALRAARHVIANNRQVALLAPTTLLVQQHYDTARERFPDLKNKIGLLSRFVSSAEQNKVRQQIQTGEISLVIGTHALLSKNTIWQSLGLVIVDEEQRFGVKHKEHFKKIRATVNFISLSATPIPRTLSMALSGLKKLSVISTPPLGRQEVITQVTRFNETIFKKAIEQEIARDGQVYIVAPKVRSLGAIAHQVKTLVPEASIAIAHGQLPPHQLAHIMHHFDAKKISILVSSSIIENGLDLPNANTIIVMSAPNFGLSDLYQLRGRVGRRSRQGYAYFFYNQTDLAPIQRQRLAALTEASRLGSGWSLAQRDLEIRGAGNLLGAQQSGSVNQVGVQLYLDLVHDAIAAETNQTVRRHDVDIQLPLAALIPTHYIAQDSVRSQHYQELSRAATPADLTLIANRIMKTYGNPPIEFKNLLLVLKLQHTLSSAKITNLSSQEITPSDEDPYWRLTVTAKDVKEILQKIQPLGTWTVRNNTLTQDLNDITPQFLEQINVLLST